MTPDELLDLARQRLILAEIRSLQGYDHKLLERLIDSSRLSLDEAGNVCGLRDAVAAVEREFPAVKATHAFRCPSPVARNTPKRSPINDLFRK